MSSEPMRKKPSPIHRFHHASYAHGRKYKKKPVRMLPPDEIGYATISLPPRRVYGFPKPTTDDDDWKDWKAKFKHRTDQDPLIVKCATDSGNIDVVCLAGTSRRLNPLNINLYGQPAKELVQLLGNDLDWIGKSALYVTTCQFRAMTMHEIANQFPESQREHVTSTLIDSLTYIRTGMETALYS